jgi:hypothetical protein
MLSCGGFRLPNAKGKPHEQAARTTNDIHIGQRLEWPETRRLFVSA